MKIRIANFSDSIGSRWHIFRHTHDTCLCQKHRKTKLNKRRVVKKPSDLAEAKIMTEDSLGQLHGNCLQKAKKLKKLEEEKEQDE